MVLFELPDFYKNKMLEWIINEIQARRAEIMVVHINEWRS